MITIVKKGNKLEKRAKRKTKQDKATYSHKCKNCGAKFLFQGEDVKRRHYARWAEIECPVCKDRHLF